jgi:hypothetical protein
MFDVAWMDFWLWLPKCVRAWLPNIQLAMPLAVEIQKDLLIKFGYPQYFMCAMQMIMAIRMAAMSDPELMAQVTLLQNKVMAKA